MNPRRLRKRIGQLTPTAVVGALSTAEAVFRVCVAPETFGVADAIAEVVGAQVHALFTSGTGASVDVLSSPFLTSDPQSFAAGLVDRGCYGPPVPRGDYRVSTVIKEWERVMFA